MLWYDAVLYRGLNLGPPALKVSTLTQGYGGGTEECQVNVLVLYHRLD